MAKRLLSVLVFILGASLLVSLTRSLLKLRSAQQRLNALEEQVAVERQEKKSLEKVVAIRRTLDYVEQEARNRLQMVKEGERIVVLPSEKTFSNSTHRKDPGSIMGLEENLPEQLAPWKQWASIFGIIDTETK